MDKKYLLVPVVITFLAIFIFGSGVQAAPLEKRVIAHGKSEVDQALQKGCRVARTVEALTALHCPESVAQALSLPEDMRMFALDDARDDFRAARRAEVVALAFPNRLNQIGADLTQANGNTGSGRTVVVLDTGYNYNHPELTSSYGGGKDFVNNDNDPADDNGHGSHVAGIITADGIDPKATGVAPNAKVIAGKVLDQNGAGYFSDLVAGIYWAVNGPDGTYGTSDDFNPDAISISLGTSAPYLYRNSCDTVLPDLTNAIKYATEKNVTVVVAAGNSGSGGVSLPGCISYSTTVGAVDNSDKIASFSGRGNAVEITAPGVNIYSTLLGTSYASWSGTSMATPVISAVVALIKSAHPTDTQVQVQNRLLNTAKDLGSRGKDRDYGWGRVRANLAVQ